MRLTPPLMSSCACAETNWQMLRGTDSAELRSAIAEVADEAVGHLLAARGMRDEVPARAREVLLPATVAEHILTRLQRHGNSPFAPEARAPLGVGLQLSLLWRRFSGTY